MSPSTAEIRASALSAPNTASRTIDVVVCGSYRRDIGALREDIEELRRLGCRILSPTSTNFVDEVDGFVFAAGEEGQSPRELEIRHLAAIEHADMVWLHAPDGYMGLSGSMEVGFAHSLGLPIFSRSNVSDVTLREFVTFAQSPARATASLGKPMDAPPVRALNALQAYYKKACEERGYDNESARDCLLLLTEEVGELARAVRKSTGLKREGGYGNESVAHELADVALYVLHLANISGVNIATALREKEAINASRFVSRARFSEK